MAKKKKAQKEENPIVNEDIKEEVTQEEKAQEETSNEESEETDEKEVKVEVKIELTPEQKLNEANDKYLRLSAEFDNYRRRTLKERADLLKTASEKVIVETFTIMDDFERALSSINEENDIDTIKNGVELILNKFQDFYKKQGVSVIENEDNNFDTDIHEAITKFPAPDESLKGKVIDTIQKGYKLNDKVVRYAKVVVGE